MENSRTIVDSWIHSLNVLFISSIVFWAFAAWRELWIYRHIRKSFSILARLTRAPDTFDLKRIPDCLVARGTYKFRNIVCRLCHISPTRLLYYRVDIHCHAEPGTTSRNMVSYRATTFSETKRYFLTERMSEKEIIDILEDVVHAAEAAEARSEG